MGIHSVRGQHERTPSGDLLPGRARTPRPWPMALRPLIWPGTARFPLHDRWRPGL